MSGVFRERAERVTLLGSAVRVDEGQFARLHRLLAEVGRSLDVSETPGSTSRPTRVWGR